jgi:hypothetical protein
MNMSEAAVKHDKPSSAPVAQDAKQGRERSTIDFPYTSLDDGITVAKAVHKLGGNQCRLDSLAAELGHDTVNSGGFRQKLSTAHTFGFTSLSQGVVTLNSLGSRIVDPEQEKAARVEAFLKVPLYNAIYEQFKNGTLPPAQGLETAMVSLGVSNKQKEKARQAFQKSAKEAGFFAYGATKLVYPALGNVAATQKPKEDKDEPSDPKGKDKGDGGGDDGRHPLIAGLIKALPDTGADWSLDARKKWLQAAAMNFDYVYTDSTNDAGSIKVAVERETSAK